VTFFRAVINCDSSALEIEFKIADDANLSDEMNSRLSFQLAKLGLNTRYQAELNLYITSHTVAMHGLYFVAGEDAVKSLLNAQATQEEESFYPSHCRPVLLKGLSENSNFCNGNFKKYFALATKLAQQYPFLQT